MHDEIPEKSCIPRTRIDEGAFMISHYLISNFPWLRAEYDLHHRGRRLSDQVPINGRLAIRSAKILCMTTPTSVRSSWSMSIHGIAESVEVVAICGLTMSKLWGFFHMQPRKWPENMTHRYLPSGTRLGWSGALVICWLSAIISNLFDHN
jgi:hypothetical protein